jgi:hypothetical protein
MKDYKKRVKCNKCKRLMSRDLKADFGTQHHGDIWPMASYAAGVHPKQMTKFDREHGVPTHYTPDGDPIFKGPRHRKKYCEAHGLYDRNAGHRDPVPARCQ